MKNKGTAMSQKPQDSIPVARPAPSFAPPRKGMPAWAVVLIVLGGLAVVILPLLALILPAVNYARSTADKGVCVAHLANISKTSQLLASVPNGPIGDKWIEGFACADGDGQFDDTSTNAIEKSRLAFWRLIADPKISKLCISPGGPQVFICPAATVVKEPAKLMIACTAQRDFPDPRKNLFYSMFNQSRDGIIPTYGTHPNFIIMGDRSPQDDGYALDANSANHRWGDTNTGQNLCYSSGMVKWVETTNVGIDEDEIYARGSDVATPITKSTVPVDANDTILMPVAE